MNGRPVEYATPQKAQYRKHRPDYWLVILSIALLSIGLVVVYSISPALGAARNVSSNFYTTHQLIAIAISAVAFIVAANIPFGQWRAWYKPLLALGAIATIIALLMPVNPDYPAHRWIRLGGLSFQSVELLKFGLLVWLAVFLEKRIRTGKITDVQTTLKPLVIALVVIGLVVTWQQSDFGSTMVIVAMIGGMVFVAGMPMKRLMMIGAILAIGGLLAISAVPYRRDRVLAFFQGETSASCSSLATGYQACQAIVSVGSGGLIGLGLGRSVQAYGYLPEAANDSIFAIYAEKFGFVGVAVLIGLFLAFFSRLKLIAERAPDMFSRLFVMGVLVWLSVQMIINVGAMIGLLPLKGITLPFVSYGGTSVIFIMVAIGIVFQISRYTSHVDQTANARRSVSENRFNRRR